MATQEGFEFDDLNDDDQIGFDSPQVTVDDKGTRADTYRSYILPVQHRRNLYVLKHAHVTKVLIEDGKATGKNAKVKHSLSSSRLLGVELYRYGKMKTFKSKREVILSAGAVGSPKILMHSGIGPESHLRDLKVSGLS